MSVDQHAIFIAYRRDDSADTAGRMFDNLEREFGEERIFKDVDSIPPGMASASTLSRSFGPARYFSF